LSPIVEDIGKARGRPRKESMLESPKKAEYEPQARVRTPVIQPSTQYIPPPPTIARLSPAKLKPITEAPETLQEYEYKMAKYDTPIKKEISKAFGNSSAMMRIPNSTDSDYIRSLMILKGHLLPEDTDNKYALLPTPENKALVDKISGLTARAYETKEISDIVDANKNIEKLINIIKKRKTGLGLKKQIKQKPKKTISKTGKRPKDSGTTLTVSKADKLRIKLIIGEIKAGNNNPMLLKEINKLKKKYSK
jgi:hypothetical protein